MVIMSPRHMHEAHERRSNGEACECGITPSMSNLKLTPKCTDAPTFHGHGATVVVVRSLSRYGPAACAMAPFSGHSAHGRDMRTWLA